MTANAQKPTTRVPAKRLTRLCLTCSSLTSTTSCSWPVWDVMDTALRLRRHSSARGSGRWRGAPAATPKPVQGGGILYFLIPGTSRIAIFTWRLTFSLSLSFFMMHSVGSMTFRLPGSLMSFGGNTTTCTQSFPVGFPAASRHSRTRDPTLLMLTMGIIPMVSTMAWRIARSRWYRHVACFRISRSMQSMGMGLMIGHAQRFGPDT
mmetsp:Transcript_73233/g.191975  ORF Transcript_73233/g.191975 Transcript_73233/m.191975 type:complete len:206 (-) Transcript_73233:2080-2697(-)